VHEARGMESTWQHGKAWEWGVGVGCEAFVLAGDGCHKRHERHDAISH